MGTASKKLGYEELREVVAALFVASSSDPRDVSWANPGVDTIGLARDESGHIEVFLVCEPIAASTSEVRDSLSIKLGLQ